MQILREFGIPFAEALRATDAEGAVRAAERLGYPVAVKVDSPDVAHKTEAGGVRLGCDNAPAVRHAVAQILDEVGRRAPSARIDGVLVQRMIAGGTEMILGVKRDPLFGPAVVCGFGGVFAEVLRDVSLRVPPLYREEALQMTLELRGSALLRGARGRPPADIGALADALVRLGALAEAHHQQLSALDLNPLLVLDDGGGVVALDWLIEFD